MRVRRRVVVASISGPVVLLIGDVAVRNDCVDGATARNAKLPPTIPLGALARFPWKVSVNRPDGVTRTAEPTACQRLPLRAWMTTSGRGVPSGAMPRRPVKRSRARPSARTRSVSVGLTAWLIVTPPSGVGGCVPGTIVSLRDGPWGALRTQWPAASVVVLATTAGALSPAFCAMSRTGTPGAGTPALFRSVPAQRQPRLGEGAAHAPQQRLCRGIEHDRVDGCGAGRGVGFDDVDARRPVGADRRAVVDRDRAAKDCRDILRGIGDGHLQLVRAVDERRRADGNVERLARRARLLVARTSARRWRCRCRRARTCRSSCSASGCRPPWSRS